MGIAEDNSGAKFKEGLCIGEWRITKKIDSGGFGQVYKVENEVTHVVAALKAEPNVREGSTIKQEINLLTLLNRDGERTHIPRVYHSGKKKRFQYMIMTLLGDNVSRLRSRCHGKLMTPETWSRIGIQCLFSLKHVHDIGHVHRDVKPQNFAMGNPDSPEKSRIIHILDFGLARAYAWELDGGGGWVARKARPTAAFRGTTIYASPSVHERKEQGRKDDLWSLLYVLIDLHNRLPWHYETDRHAVTVCKFGVSDEKLLEFFPEEMHPWLPHLRSLDCYSRPDYEMIYDCFHALMTKLNVKPGMQYDWNRDDEVNMEAADGGPPRNRLAWETPNLAKRFFKSDPVNIHGPPPKGPLHKPLMKTQEVQEV